MEVAVLQLEAEFRVQRLQLEARQPDLHEVPSVLGPQRQASERVHHRRRIDQRLAA